MTDTSGHKKLPQKSQDRQDKASQRPSDSDPEQRELPPDALAEQPAIAGSNNRALQDELETFQALYDLAIAMTGDRTLEESLTLVVEKSRELLRTDGSYLFLRDEGRGDVYMHSHTGIRSSDMLNLRLPFGKGIGGTIVQTRKGLIVEDYFSDQQIDKAPQNAVAEEGIVALIAVPLQFGETNLGALFVFNRKKTAFPTHHLDTLFLIGNLAAVEIARKQTAERLRKTNETLEAVINCSPAAIVGLNQDARLTLWNPAAEKIFGWKKEEVLGGSYPAVPEDLKDEFKIIFKAQVIHREFYTDLALRRQKKDGTNFYVSANTAPLTDETGDVIGYLSVMTDSTDRIRAENALRESEERYRSLVEMSPNAVVVHIDGKIRYINQAGAKLLGTDRPETLIGRRVLDFVQPDFRKEVEKRFESLQSERHPLVSMEEKLVRLDGKEVDVESTGSFVVYGGQPATLSVFSDISEKKQAKMERKQLETRLNQAVKLEALGTLAGGIAHDFNNLLMGIQGNTSLILLDMHRDNPDYDRLKSIESYVRSGSKLTQQMLGLARGGRYDPRPTDMNRVLNDSADLFGRTRKEISIHRKLEKDLWAVDADQGQMKQVLANLFVNAWQAMPGGGDLYLESKNVQLAEKESERLSLDPGKFVNISVRDTGVGMNSITLRRIFDPFFTTKSISRGTGLGLASTYGIVSNHGGAIDVESHPGRGSIFRLYFPAVRMIVETEKKKAQKLVSGSETVLLIDDEDLILDVGGEMLSRLGYHVLKASSGTEAVKMYEHRPDQIDLVILDMIMPKMGGGQTYSLLKAIDPEVKVLLSSGYSINGKAVEIMELGCDGFIQKPFNINELSLRIRKILDHFLPSGSPSNFRGNNFK